MISAALLLDLDGTLVDTAPDMVACLNVLLAEQDRAPVAFEVARRQVSNGAAGLLALGFGMAANDSRLADLRTRYLEIYATRISESSIIFQEFCSVFDVLYHYGWSWGVVTNKPQVLAGSLLGALNLRPSRDCLVGGDTLPERKPHPAPLLHAARILDVPAQRCIYVGDAERDIQAGRAAGMRTIAARYGYLSDPQEADRWQADHVIDSPVELAGLLGSLAAEMARAS